MPTKPRVPDPKAVVSPSSLTAAEAILAPLDALLTAASKDDLMDRARPAECADIRRSGKWLQKVVVKLLDATRPTATAAGQAGTQGRTVGP